MLPLTLPCSPLFSTSMWITSINIIHAFHLGLLRSRLYSHISYAFRVDIQRTLHIPLFRLTFNRSYITTWHFKSYSLLDVCPFLHEEMRKVIKRLELAYVDT